MAAGEQIEWSVDEHPYVRAAEAELRLARRVAAALPFPYAAGTRVRVLTPVGGVYEGTVVSCDPEGFLRVHLPELPSYFSGIVDGAMTFYAITAPERVDEDKLIFLSQYRIDPAPEQKSEAQA